MPASNNNPLAHLASLSTEQRNPNTSNLDVVPTLELCEIINREDATVATAVSRCLPEIARIIDELAPRLRAGGRVIYVGAGTSGRLGVLDASEIPPTFSAPYGQFIGIIAGGDRAIRFAVEGAEDSLSLPVTDLSSLTPPLQPQLDSVIGLTASGRTPYVLGALRYARELGCFTGGVCCSSPSEMGRVGEVIVECPVGGEVVTGSTRMKSGTAQKMVLNMISTGVQIRIGKTYGNLMVDVKTSNIKLLDRARRIFRAVLVPLTEPHMSTQPSIDTDDDGAVDRLIAKCGGSVKTAVIAARWGCGAEEAVERLEEVDGVLKKALEG